MTQGQVDTLLVYTGVFALVLFAFLQLGIWAWRRLFGTKRVLKAQETTPTSGAATSSSARREQTRLCVVCKKLDVPHPAEATHPLPGIAQSHGGRWAWLLTALGVPPIYSRGAGDPETPEVCETHSYLGEALTDTFVAEDVRAALAHAHSKVAARVAWWQREGLVNKLVEVSTEESAEPARATQRSAPTLVASRPPLRSASNG